MEAPDTTHPPRAAPPRAPLTPAPSGDPVAAYSACVDALRVALDEHGVRGLPPASVPAAAAAALAPLVATAAAARAAAARAAARSPTAAAHAAACRRTPRGAATAASTPPETEAAVGLVLAPTQVAEIATLTAATHARLASVHADRRKLNAALPTLLASADAAVEGGGAADAALAALRRNLRSESAARAAADHTLLTRLLHPAQAAALMADYWPGSTVDALAVAAAAVPEGGGRVSFGGKMECNKNDENNA